MTADGKGEDAYFLVFLLWQAMAVPCNAVGQSPSVLQKPVI